MWRNTETQYLDACMVPPSGPGLSSVLGANPLQSDLLDSRIPKMDGKTQARLLIITVLSSPGAACSVLAVTLSPWRGVAGFAGALLSLTVSLGPRGA